MDSLFEALIALVALTAMEIVLGIDNVVFIVILTDRLPKHQQAKGRRLGLAIALVTRILLLCALKWLMGLTEPIFTLSQFGVPENWLGEEVNQVSWRDLILLGGGLFLIGKSVHEIHNNIDRTDRKRSAKKRVSFALVLIEIAILDIIFSLDSVITAIGMAEHLWVMIVAIMLAISVMLVCAEAVSEFVSRHPTLKILALSFLILIGIMLVAQGIGTHIDKGYIYFAMGFALLVEFLNLKVRSKVRASKVSPETST